MVMRSQAPWEVARLELGSDASLSARESGRRNAPPQKTIPSFLLSGAPALRLQVNSEVGAGSRLWGEQEEGTRPGECLRETEALRYPRPMLLDAFGAATGAGGRGAT